ncbi:MULTISPECIES: MliC family protein [Fusobacterium]|nr:MULTISPECIES: MliC family protein [Fusobacterium]EUB14746.1 membrane-bound lysozyme-inhibitor of C-type lysozyme [Fusobacterium sp. CM22]
MKKFAMLALAMSLFLVACGEKKEEEKPAEQPATEAAAPAPETTAPATEAAAEAKTFSLKTEDGKEFTLVVAADGATATLTDAEGKATELKNAETASGERYADDAGNEVAMKGTEGILTLGDLKEVPVTVEAK